MNQLYTRWGKEIDPEHVLEEYPRPQLQRYSYTILNGLWNCTFTSAEETDFPTSYDQKILVPFSPETVLSGVQRQLQPDELLWYEREFPIKLFIDHAQILKYSRDKAPERVLLHFGAVDQSCTVYIDHIKVCEHTGGYLPFTVDITDEIQDYLDRYSLYTEESDFADHTQKFPVLTVCVRDVSDTSYHARGKQKLASGGMYYTATSGIWQTVWAEIVPEIYIRDLKIETDIDKHTLTVTAFTNTDENVPLTVMTENFDAFPGKSNTPIVIGDRFDSKWTPHDPKLHLLTVNLSTGDRVQSYYAMRSIGIENDKDGIPRICLNHKPIYMNGVLDQGYWPDGMYTPPSDEAIIFDLTEMKACGFNMVRKHAKLESDRWYYHCDRLGILVWQDIVNGGDAYNDNYVTVQPNLWNWKNTKHKTFNTNKTGRASEEGRREFQKEIIETAGFLKNHPSVVAWTLFNEGWGQFETAKCLEILRTCDPVRPIDAASGWFDQDLGDFRSIHNYFFPLRVYRERERAFIFSEVGGFPMLVKGHSACDKIYGYGKKYTDASELTKAYKDLNRRLLGKIPNGLCASVYTQWTDIENEVNGVYTWDREVKKINL